MGVKAEEVTAAKIKMRYQKFVRRSCSLKNSQESRITQAYRDFFEKIGSKVTSLKLNRKGVHISKGVQSIIQIMFNSIIYSYRI